MHLTAEQDGIYRRLIDHYMETKQALPDSDSALARIAGVTEPLFASHWCVISQFFTWENEKLFSETCEEILEDQAKRDKKRKVRAKKGAASRWKHKVKPKMPQACLDDAYVMLGDATEQNRTEQNNKNKPPVVPLKNGDGSKKLNGSKRGSRLDSDWMLPKDWGEWALNEGMGTEKVLEQEEVFRDYWIARPGMQGVKLDWQATWRNWIRKSKEYGNGKF